MSIIGCHNCSYSAILNSFLYLQLYDIFFLSLLHVHWILCYRIKNNIFHGIHKATEAKDLCAV